MKPRLVDAAQDRLATAATGPQTALDAALTEEDVLRILARIARTGKPGDRLRAAELVGKQLGMVQGRGQAGTDAGGDGPRGRPSEEESTARGSWHQRGRRESGLQRHGASMSPDNKSGSRATRLLPRAPSRPRP
jgi:hypothetical protein